MYVSTRTHKSRIPEVAAPGILFAMNLCADCQTTICPATCRYNVKLYLLRQK